MLTQSHVGCIGEGCPLCAKIASNPKIAAALRPKKKPASPLCRHLGKLTGERVECKECPGTRPVSVCAIHGKCTIGRNTAGLPFCLGGCNDFSPKPAHRFEWISTRRLAADTVDLLIAKLPHDISGIVGIPRSGMIPAAILATMLQLPLYTLRDGDIELVGHGSRGRNLGFAGADNGPLLVVDDTVYGGDAMRSARAALKSRNVKFAAVYVRPEMSKVVDFYGRTLPNPHLLEWNLFNNGPFVGRASDSALRGGVALDFDGIICHDFTGDPYRLPRSLPVKLIITNRLEKDRAATEAWLHKWGVRCDKMIMQPVDDPSRRLPTSEHKAKHFKESRCSLFIESDPVEAELIFKHSGKPVVCPAIETVFQ